MEWVFAHLEDPDFNDPLPEPGAAPAAEDNSEQVAMLTAMGFSAEQAGAALKATGTNVERAADWLFSHMDDMEAAVASVLNKDQAPAAGGA
eukprot:6112826-Pleurochrysis_carterae.AAC.1